MLWFYIVGYQLERYGFKTFSGTQLPGPLGPGTFSKLHPSCRGFVMRKTGKESIAPKDAPGEKTEWKSNILKQGYQTRGITFRQVSYRDSPPFAKPGVGVASE
uniref:Uncharacterized protein n=1 Tax=Micrurus lemniscatus lemniscatus TaxID=129467 RepID=A0A2D4J606_MICLE